MKRFLLFTVVLLTSIQVRSQDVITTRQGQTIKAKITEVGASEVKYKKFGNEDGPLYTILKSEILVINYEGGATDIFQDQSISNQPAAIDQIDYSAQGRSDANRFYSGQQSGSGWVAATTVLTSPIIGLIPAAICASNPPKDVNLNYPDGKLMKNDEYYNSYVKAAHKTKKRSVWSGFGIGTAGYLVIIALLL